MGGKKKKIYRRLLNAKTLHLVREVLEPHITGCCTTVQENNYYKLVLYLHYSLSLHSKLLLKPGLNGDLFCASLCIFDLCFSPFVLGLGFCFSFFLLTMGLASTSAVFLLRSREAILLASGLYCPWYLIEFR